MSHDRLITLILSSQDRPPVTRDGEDVVTLEELKATGIRGVLRRYLLRYRSARYLVYDQSFVYLPFKVGLALRLFSRRTCWFEDRLGHSRKATLWFIARSGFMWVVENLYRPFFLRGIYREVDRLGRDGNSGRRGLDLSRPAVYLRSDLNFEIKAGGAVAHTSGVLTNLQHFTGGKPIFVTTGKVATVGDDIETHIVFPEQRFWDFRELPRLYFNRTFFDKAQAHVRQRRLSFVYHRYSVNSFAALKLARFLGIPMVLEYNGSDVWIARNWGSPLDYEDLAMRIEDLVLRSATMIVVVSEPLKEELVGRGIDSQRVLVNPNGVDPDHYRPDIDGSAVSERFELSGKTVIGFIGSFGRWHGAEVLAKAFALLVAADPSVRDGVRLLMIGDGVMMREVRDTLSTAGIDDVCVLTGIVPQERGPEHLAACDVLVSPHVPNPDGSPFFGSPTKLFEYMAMGKAIVASDLDQIGEVLDHGRTAWLVAPGDPPALVEGLKVVLGDGALRTRLGEQARKEVVEKYTWRRHTQSIVERLAELCG